MSISQKDKAFLDIISTAAAAEVKDYDKRKAAGMELSQDALSLRQLCVAYLIIYNNFVKSLKFEELPEEQKKEESDVAIYTGRD